MLNDCGVLTDVRRTFVYLMAVRAATDVERAILELRRLFMLRMRLNGHVLIVQDFLSDNIMNLLL